MLHTMDLDNLDLDPAQRQQAEMFAVMVGQMPTDAIAFLIALLQSEVDARADDGD